MSSSVKNAASSAAPILSDHAAQNLRTTSMGLSIWLLLRSIFGELSNTPCATFQLDDGVSFVHLASNDTEHGPSPLATNQGLLQKRSSPADARYTMHLH